MKILNLYAGIGGNRKLWGDEHEITAVEYKSEIAKIYQDLFPKDKVVVGDAHKYLLDHFDEFDFIWSSPPCQSHSKLSFLRMGNYGKTKPSQSSRPHYPDMKLYQEIIFLRTFFKGKYCLENVVPYYVPLIPAQEFQRHLFWANFMISEIRLDSDNIEKGVRKDWELKTGFNLDKYKGLRKDTLLRNCVRPELGKHILDCALVPRTLF